MAKTNIFLFDKLNHNDHNYSLFCIEIGTWIRPDNYIFWKWFFEKSSATEISYKLSFRNCYPLVSGWAITIYLIFGVDTLPSSSKVFSQTATSLQCLVFASCSTANVTCFKEIINKLTLIARALFEWCSAKIKQKYLLINFARYIFWKLYLELQQSATA